MERRARHGDGGFAILASKNHFLMMKTFEFDF